MSELGVIKIGVLTSSDRASAGVYEDISGKAVQEVLSEYIKNELDFHYRLVADDMDKIVGALSELVGVCDLVVTTGGTGPAARDITPEATRAVIQKELPGFGEQMRAVSLKYVPTAILSRQLAGIVGSCLVINLPGKPKSIRECLEAIFPAVPYCIDLIGGGYIEVNEKVISAFRPKSK